MLIFLSKIYVIESIIYANSILVKSYRVKTSKAIANTQAQMKFCMLSGKSH